MRCRIGWTLGYGGGDYPRHEGTGITEISILTNHLRKIMAGVMVTTDVEGKVVRRSARLDNPNGIVYPVHLESGDTTWFSKIAL